MAEGEDGEEAEEENGLVALEGEREAATLQQGRIPFMDRFGKWSSNAVGSVKKLNTMHDMYVFNVRARSDCRRPVPGRSNAHTSSLAADSRIQRNLVKFSRISYEDALLLVLK